MIWAIVKNANRKPITLTINGENVVLQRGELVGMPETFFEELKRYFTKTEAPTNPINHRKIGFPKTKNKVIVIKKKETIESVIEEPKEEKVKEIEEYSFKELKKMVSDLGKDTYGLKKAELIAIIKNNETKTSQDS